MSTEEQIIIKINGEEVITTIDKNGTQRLPQDPTIDKLFNAGLVDLNTVAIAAQGGKYPRTIGLRGTFTPSDRFILYRDYLGYSVSGFLDVFPSVKIENPLWD